MIAMIARSVEIFKFLPINRCREIEISSNAGETRFSFQFVCRRDRSSLLPFHVTRTVLCMTVLAALFLELCESLLTSVSCSSILTIVATICCWILHRETEVRNGLGTAISAGIFAAIGLSRAWKFMYFSRSVSIIINPR